MRVVVIDRCIEQMLTENTQRRVGSKGNQNARLVEGPAHFACVGVGGGCFVGDRYYISFCTATCWYRIIGIQDEGNSRDGRISIC